MHHPAFTPVDRPAHPAADPFSADSVPTRVIEVGEMTAGIAVPEGRRVRFFSSARDFDGLDGAVFGSAEQAARAARERARALARASGRRSARAVPA
jgi:hypothetical protein